MGRIAIPNHQQTTWDHALQLSKKGDYFCTGNRMLVSFHEQPALRGDRPDQREMFVRKKLLQNGRLTTRGVGTDHDRQQINPRFVYEDDGPPFCFGLFFSSGQRSSFQCKISSALRCLDRRIGFWASSSTL